jgi:hypothetical protein
MAGDDWPTKRLSVAGLHLDDKNPRLGRETSGRAPREIIQYLFDHDKAMEVAESIATRGYFPNEPLLAIREHDRNVVVEGNRRLAALKALAEPGLLEGPQHRHLEQLSRRIADAASIKQVPTTIAPNRKATDRQIAGRHVGTPVLAWQAENRASFILDKLAEGYDNDALRDQLGFSLADIQGARQTRAIADMARSLTLPDEVRAKIDSPRAKVFTTLERVIESSVGRKHLHVEPDAVEGLRGTTTKAEFIKGFTKLVSDVALGKVSSRTLNTNENIDEYFKRLAPSDRVIKKRGSFIPADIVGGADKAPSAPPSIAATKIKSKQLSKTVLPKDLKIRHGNDRLIDIRRELVELKRDRFPNAGAVLLRVFLEIAVIDYLRRTGELAKIIARIDAKGGRLKYSVPTMKELHQDIVRIVKAKLPPSEANKIEKALRPDPAAPFTVSDLHAFVHQSADLPGERDILQFWLRTEPLFRLILEGDE